MDKSNIPRLVRRDHFDSRSLKRAGFRRRGETAILSRRRVGSGDRVLPMARTEKISAIKLEWTWASILGLGLPFFLFDLVSLYSAQPLGSKYLPLRVGTGAVVIGVLQYFIRYTSVDFRRHRGMVHRRNNSRQHRRHQTHYSQQPGALRYKSCSDPRRKCCAWVRHRIVYGKSIEKMNDASLVDPS